jgi:hypothetical protein
VVLYNNMCTYWIMKFYCICNINSHSSLFILYLDLNLFLNCIHHFNSIHLQWGKIEKIHSIIQNTWYVTYNLTCLFYTSNPIIYYGFFFFFLLLLLLILQSISYRGISEYIFRIPLFQNTLFADLTNKNLNAFFECF